MSAPSTRRRQYKIVLVPILPGRGIGRKNIGYAWKGASIHIGVAPNLSSRSRWKTILHEVLHLSDFRLKESTVLALEDRLDLFLRLNWRPLARLGQHGERQLRPGGRCGHRFRSKSRGRRRRSTAGPTVAGTRAVRKPTTSGTGSGSNSRRRRR